MAFKNTNEEKKTHKKFFPSSYKLMISDLEALNAIFY